jgi:hypothetical protein
MDRNHSPIQAAFQLFLKLNCFSNDLIEYINDIDAMLELVDEDKMRCHIINCLTSLRIVHIERINREMISDMKSNESMKIRVFNAAIAMIVGEDCECEEAVLSAILTGFPDERRICDERSWLPQHFAIALAIRDKISEDDVREMLSSDTLAKQRFSTKQQYLKESFTEGTPDFLPLKFDSFRDPELQTSCKQDGKCALHLVAEFSESVELLQDFLRMPCMMTKMIYDEELIDDDGTTPLSLLCRRDHFLSFDQMVLCFIEVDSDVEVIYDGISYCLSSCKNRSFRQDISPGSRDERTLILLRTLLDANLTVAKYGNSHIFHEACMYLRGEMGISVLSLFLSIDSTGVKEMRGVELPIFSAAKYSCVDILKFLHEIYPESISLLGGSGGYSLLHLAASDERNDTDVITAKVKYLCNQNPAFIRLKDAYGKTALHYVLNSHTAFNFDCVKILCNADAMIARDKRTPANSNDDDPGQLPLHYLIQYCPPMSELSD